MTSRRCQLVCPGDKIDMIRKAHASEAGQVIIDLEDAVAPQDKQKARSRVVEAAEELDWDDTLLSIRINGLDTPYAYRDLVEVGEGAGEQLDSVVVPKVRNEKDVYFVETILDQIERNESIDSPIELEAMIEHVKGVENLFEIAGSSDDLVSLIFGPVDFSATIAGLVPSGSPNPDVSQYSTDLYRAVQIKVVQAASSYGLDAIDCMGTDNFTDLEKFGADCQAAKELGFVGYWAIHPAQIDIINETFVPNAADVEYARRVVAALDEAEAEGRGTAIRLDDMLVDTAHYRTASRILERAEEATDVGSPGTE